MPLPDHGRDVALGRNPSTGLFDFVFDETGNPAFTDSEEHTVLSLELERQGEYWADPTGKRGSLLHTVRHDRASTRSQLVALTAAPLEPAIADGRLRNVTTSAEKKGTGKYVFVVRWRNRKGEESATKLSIGY
jgi:phage gp46-like protein